MATGRLRRAWSAYRLRWKRRELLWRAIRAGGHLTPLADRTTTIRRDDILLFASLRNEITRLPEFLAHYRSLGVGHFLIVDNDSDDGGTDYLRAQPDLSVWRATGSYRAARFGMDWLGALLFRHGHGHWCVTVDADELLVYPDCTRRDLRHVTAHLDARGIAGIGALMLDLYPSGPLGGADASPDAPLTARLPWFDAGPYRCRVMQPRRNRWAQGGVRERAFYADCPDQSPTLNKLPLIRWHRRMVYVNSTHSMLPPHLNDLYDGPGDMRLSAALLHGKFLPEIVEKSHEELARRQHFVDPDAHTSYHRALTAMPVLWTDRSLRYRDASQLLELGLVGTGDWLPVCTSDA